MYEVKKKWIVGWVQLPCFKVKGLKEDNEGIGIDLICNPLLSWIWELFFSPFWNGKIHITNEVEE